MTSHLTSRFNWRIGLLVFGALALLSFAAALFMFVSDDFVLGGQVVPATDARIVVWRIGLGVVGVVFASVTWLCLRQTRRLS
jgi:hypothetical protein